uniref:GNAT family N-acetyltransferase n=1 Tax=Pararhodobacter oceanensis TaxID=2172121 RepID=UPI003A8DCD4C
QSLAATIAQAANPERLATMSNAAADICDGDGTARVMARILKAPLTFRPATGADSRRVWEWRRAVDSSAKVADEDTPFSAHDAWFKSALSDTDRSIHIAMQGQLPCGYLRLDRSQDHRARVSLCLSPEAWGRGFGRHVLTEADRLGASLGLKRLDAEVSPENRASRRIFEASGYIQGAPVGGFDTYHRILKDMT